MKGILTEGDPGKDRKGRKQGIDKFRAKSAFKAPSDTEAKKITTMIAEARGKGGLIEIPSTGAKIKDLIKAIELGCGLNRTVANNVNCRYDVRELFTTLLKYCSDVSAQYIEDLCHAFADLGLPTTGLTHWILITDVIVLSCSLDEDTTSNDALQDILDCKQGDRE